MFIAGRLAVSLDGSPKLVSRLCAGDLNPEEALLAAEAGETHEQPRTPTRRREHAAFEALATTFLDEDARRILAAHLLGSSQADLAAYLGVTQQAISIRLQRAIERLRWAATLETWKTPVPTLHDRVIPILGRSSAEVCAVETLWPSRFSRSRAARALGIGISEMNRLLAGARAHLARGAPAFARDITRAQERRSYH